MTTNIAVTVNFCSWLAMTDKGVMLNYSGVIAPGANVNQRLDVPVGYDYLLLCGIEFDGLIAGQTTYEVRGGSGNVQAGYALMTPMGMERLLRSERGQGFRYTINNGQVSAVVFNILYMAMTAQTWEREVLPMLSARVIGGH